MGVRVLAAILVVGGVAGIFVSIYLGYQLFLRHWGLVVVGIVFCMVFAWTILTGIRLWHNERRGEMWAKVLYVAQVPIITVPGFVYEYYTGFSIAILGGHVEDNLRLRLGANLSVYVDSRIDDVVYGLNLFALAAVIYLMRRKKAA